MSNDSPLNNIRVVDLTDESAVFAGRILADLGAEVIRVEPPDGGRLRKLAPFLGDAPGLEHSFQHLYHNAGKKSVVIDRTTAPGRKSFDDLVATADILFETEALDHSSIKELNPALIHVTITPFGLDGAWSKRKGNDLIASAASGMAWVSGNPNDPPNQAGANQCYKTASLAASTGALIALHGRDGGPTRGGTHLDISVHEAAAQTTLQTSNPADYKWTDVIPTRPGLTVVHRSKDKKYLTAFVTPHSLDAFLAWSKEMGLKVPENKKEYYKLVDGVTWEIILLRQLAGLLTREEFYKKAWPLKILGLPALSLPDMLSCDHYLANNQFIGIPHETLGKTLIFPRSPVASIKEASISPAPRFGEHTQNVLSQLKAPEAPKKPEATKNIKTFDMAHALRGLRVVDFTWVIAGPLGTRILANFGAEVIRVESGPRALASTKPKDHKDVNLGNFHNMLNTQKRSITLDPRSAKGRELLLKLVAKSDVVTNNYAPGAMEGMGFDYEALKKANPNIISLHMPGSGLKGPWRKVRSFGPHVTAASGLSHLTGFPGRTPRGLGVAYPDFSCPYLLVTALLAALRQRDKTGEGREIDLSQLSAIVSFIGVEWLQFTSSGEAPAPCANRNPNWSPHGIYKAKGKDEWLALAIENEAEWTALCQVIKSLGNEPKFSNFDGRKKNEDELDSLINSWSENQDKWEAADLLQSKGIPAAAVENIRDCMEKDPHLAKHYQYIVRPEYPDESIPINAEVIQVAGQRRELGNAPNYGGDNESVLKDILGLSDQEIKDLWEQKILHTADF